MEFGGREETHIHCAVKASPALAPLRPSDALVARLPGWGLVHSTSRRRTIPDLSGRTVRSHQAEEGPGCRAGLSSPPPWEAGRPLGTVPPAGSDSALAGAGVGAAQRGPCRLGLKQPEVRCQRRPHLAGLWEGVCPSGGGFRNALSCGSCGRWRPVLSSHGHAASSSSRFRRFRRRQWRGDDGGRSGEAGGQWRPELRRRL